MNNIKKFEDFLDRMQGLLDEAKKCGHIILRVEDLEDAFPELEEREDERIRKAIIEMIHDTPSIECEENYNVSKEDILAWLEKQGEKERDGWKEGNIIRHGGKLAFVIKGRRAMKSTGDIFTVQYPDEWVEASPNEIERFFNEFEKQGEHLKNYDEAGNEKADFVEKACDAYCNLCDTKECVNVGECDWVERFRKLLRR